MPLLHLLYALPLSILLHELAHLIVANICKCKVEVFSIGFGKPIIKKKIKDTTYQLAWIPFGGYCKLKDEMKYSRSKYAFTNLAYSKKLAIVLAGVTSNIIFGIGCIYLALFLRSSFIYSMGVLNIALGVTNLLPIPSLDGSYPFLVLLEKKYGKKKGYTLMNHICRVGFIWLMILQIACIPYIIWLYAIGV